MPEPGIVEPDFGKLQQILERQYGRTVSYEEARAIGEHLINVYDVLLFTAEAHATIAPDTTHR